MRVTRARWLALALVAVVAADWITKFLVQNHLRLYSRRALVEFRVDGMPTVIPFHAAVVSDPAFIGTPVENPQEFHVYTQWIETDFDNQITPYGGDSAEAPETQQRPIPRATTAAWLVMPPRAVRMPWAACMPWMSSGLVSTRTRMTFSPRPAQVSAVSASSTILPEAAPGDAGSPVVRTSRCASGSSVGWRSWSS